MNHRYIEPLEALKELIGIAKSTQADNNSVLSSIGSLVCEHPELIGTAEQLKELEAQSRLVNKRVQDAQLYMLDLTTQLVVARQAAAAYLDTPRSRAVDRQALEVQLRTALDLPVPRFERPFADSHFGALAQNEKATNDPR